LDSSRIGRFFFEGLPHSTNATRHYFSKPGFHCYDICVSVCLNSGFYDFWALINEKMYLPPGFKWLVVACMVGFGSVGYLLLISFLLVGELSAIMPFRYSRIVILLILCILVTEECPSSSMLFGSALVTFSGLYIIWREQLLSKRLDRK
jgi:drug/metabolite transporter (DMT)-like permease